MRKKIEQVFCDVCGEPARKTPFSVPVVFPNNGDQIRVTNMDLCDSCIKKGFKVYGSYNANGVVVYTAGEETDSDGTSSDDSSEQTSSSNTQDNESGENDDNSGDSTGDSDAAENNDAVSDGNTDND